MKTIMKLILVLIVLVIVAAGVAIWQIDALAKTAIEEGGTYALGVDTTVDEVHIGLLRGEASLNGLGVANPAGYPAEHKLMNTGEFSVQVETGTLREDTVVIPAITLDGLEVHLDRNDGKYNVQVITDNLKKLGGEDEPSEEPEEKKPGKKFFVKKITIKNVTGHVELPTGVKIPINIKEITPFTNISSEEGVPMSKLIGQLFPAIMGSVVSGVAELPGEVVNLLKSDLGGAAAALGGKATELLNQGFEAGAESLKNITENLPEGAGQVIEDVQKNVGDTLKDITDGDKDSGNGEKKDDPLKKIGEGIGGLLGGDKDKE